MKFLASASLTVSPPDTTIYSGFTRYDTQVTVDISKAAARPGADLGQGMAALLSALLTVFLLANVPTLLLLALYLICRRSRRRKRQMEHMNIQDL